MKLRHSLSFALCSSLLAPSAFAAGKVEKAAQALGDLLSNGSSTVTTESSDPIEMLKAYYIEQYSDDEVPDVQENGKEFKFDGNDLGLFDPELDVEKLINNELSYCVENDMVDPDGENPKAAEQFTKKAGKLVHRMAAMPGVVFGFDANGQGWGGMPISILLVVDTMTHKVHGITMQCNAYHD